MPPRPTVRHHLLAGLGLRLHCRIFTCNSFHYCSALAEDGNPSGIFLDLLHLDLASNLCNLCNPAVMPRPDGLSDTSFQGCEDDSLLIFPVLCYLVSGGSSCGGREGGRAKGWEGRRTGGREGGAAPGSDRSGVAVP